jgi:sugar phosphate isomerase/epimerase
MGRLQQRGFDGVISIEHEDRDWGFGTSGDPNLRKEGLLRGKRILETVIRGAPS